MGRLIDLTGKAFGRLTVVASAGRRKIGNSFLAHFWLCRCSCGEQITVSGHALRSGNTKSCGCFRKEIVGLKHRTHGMSRHHGGIYGIWKGIVQRCTNPKNRAYADYGGRGITLHKPWRGFETFMAEVIAEIGEHPDGLEIDRIKNDEGYKPGNIKWSTRAEQNRNTRQNRLITFRGKTQVLSEWAKEIGIGAPSLSERLEKWPLEEALTIKGRLSKYHKKGL